MKPKALQPPSDLTPAQTTEFERVARELADVAIAIGVDAIASYPVSYCRWRDAEKRIAEGGAVVKLPNGYDALSPYLAVSITAARQMRQFQDRAADARRRAAKVKSKQRPTMRLAQDDDDELSNAVG